MPIQVLEREPSWEQKLFASLGGGLSQGLNERQQRKQQTQLMQQENDAAKRMGIDLSGISDPRLRERVIAESLKQQTQEKKTKTRTRIS